MKAKINNFVKAKQSSRDNAKMQRKTSETMSRQDFTIRKAAENTISDQSQIFFFK